MKLKKIILALLLCSVSAAAAEFPDFKFKYYTVDDGLSVNTVTAVMQDSRGFMWFATSEGLNSFDGNSFRSFVPDGKAFGVGVINAIQSIAETPGGNILVGTDFGVFIFNPKTEKFRYYTGADAGGHRISTPVYDICVGRENRRGGVHVWVATYGQGVFQFDASVIDEELDDSSAIIHYTDNDILPTNYIRNIHIDSSGRVWVLSYGDKFGYFSSDFSTMRLFSHYGGSSLERYDVILEGDDDVFWLGNYTKGLSRLDLKTGKFEDFFISADGSTSIGHIRCMRRYGPNMLLIASDDGLVCFDTETGQYKILTPDTSQYMSINDRYVHALYIDNEGGLWVCTYFGGVNYSSPSSNNFKLFSPHSAANPIEGKIISVVETDDDDNLWIGTDDAGVIYYDRKKRKRVHYIPNNGKNSISYHNIHAICCDGDEVWIGTYSAGIDVLNRKTGQRRHYDVGYGPGHLIHSSIYSIVKDTGGRIWIGTPSGCSVYDRETDSFADVEELRGADVSCIQEDRNGYLWVASYNNGLSRLDLQTGKWKHFKAIDGKIPSDIVTTVSCGEKGKLWIGTNGQGIAVYDEAGQQFSAIDIDVLEKTPVHKIIEYGDCLWVSTNKGLVRIYKSTLKYKVYGTSDGVQSVQFCPNSGAVTDDGVLFFGGINGLNGFIPADLAENTVIPSVYITSLSLDGRPVTPGDDTGILSEAVSWQKEIVVKHIYDIIELGVAATSYAASDNNKYLYRLEGFEEKWHSAPQGKNVTYTKLNPGSYTFRVKASNNDDLWNENGAELKIKVLPPPWLSPWALAAYSLAFVLLVIAFCLFMMQRVKAKHRSSMMRLRVAKEKELYESKLAFFTDMIHEIRTPLTLIAGPIEHIMKHSKGLSESTKDDLRIIRRNSGRLLNLVNQLLDFRKAEAGTMKLNLTDTNISLCIRQIYSTFVPTAEQKGISMVLDMSDDQICGKADGGMLNKIVSNLLSNALKFTRDKVVLTVSCDWEDRENARLTIVCEDNGGGVPDEEKNKIFNPFYQIRSNQPKDGVGSGVGLSLLRSMTTYVGGYVAVEDAPELGGALFRISLPFTRCSAEAVGMSTSEDEFEENENPGDESLQAMGQQKSEAATVMLVDDNPDMLSFLASKLGMHYNVVTFDNAVDAYASLETSLPDLIISDVMMGGMDGFTFCRKIKNTLVSCHISVILLTAKVDMDSKIEGLDCGADIYVEKPFSIDLLEAQIHSLLLNRKKIQESFANQPSAEVAMLATTKEDTVFLKKVDDYIEKNLCDVSFTAADMAAEIGMSRSAFFAKLRAVTGQTPSDYVRLIRLKRAVKLFNEGETRINEVCYMTGFNSPSYFSKCFQQQFGEVPTMYVKRIRNEIVANKDSDGTIVQDK